MLHVDTNTTKPMRIALLNSTDYAGGAETVARMLRDGLRQRGHDILFWVGRRTRDDDGEGTLALPVSTPARRKARRFAQHGFFNIGLDASVRFCASPVPDGFHLFHLHNLHGHYFSIDSLPRLASHVPLVWTLHDFFPITGGCAFPFDCNRWMTQCGSCPQLGRYPLVTSHDRTRRLLAIKRKAFREMPVAIVTPSEHLKRAVLRSQMFAAAEVRVIPYGVDTGVFKPDRDRARQELGLPAHQPTVLLIAQGLDDPRKGIQHALSAAGRVDVSGLTVLVVGAGNPGPMVNELRGREVRACGYIVDRRELARCYSAADLVLFPSLAENFPCVVLEAMACGTPVLAFDTDGVNEQIDSDGTGFLVPAGDTDELTRMAQALLRSPTALREAGAAARQHALTHWSEACFLDRHEQLYRDVLAGHHPSRVRDVDADRYTVPDAP